MVIFTFAGVLMMNVFGEVEVAAQRAVGGIQLCPLTPALAGLGLLVLLSWLSGALVRGKGHE